MSNSSCVNDCGLFGNCIASECVCKQGWSNTFDSQFALSPSEFLDSSEKFSSLPCLQNASIERSFYAIHALLAATGFILTSLAIRRKSQLIRGVVPLLTMASIFTLSVYRSVKRDTENVLANDIFIGIFTAAIAAGAPLTLLLFMNKYIVFKIQIQSDAEEQTRLQLRVIEKIAVCATVFFFLVAGVLIKDVRKRNIVFKVGLGICALTISWLIYETVVQFNFLLNQLEKVRVTLLVAEKKRKLTKLLRGIKCTIVFNSSIVVAVLILTVIRIELLIWLFHLILVAVYATSLGMNILYRKVDKLNKTPAKSKIKASAATSKHSYDETYF